MSLDAYKNDTEGLRCYLKKFKTTVVRTEYPFVTVGGEFEEDGNIIIHIFGEYERKCFDNDEWFMFKFRLIQTMMHELLHWRQFERRGHGYARVLKYISMHKEAAYYSSKDEIEAYSHCIILELYRELKHFNLANIMDFSEYSETYEYIFHTVFNCNYNNIALSQYKKTITKWSKFYIALNLHAKNLSNKSS